MCAGKGNCRRLTPRQPRPPARAVAAGGSRRRRP
jgi:hypothetical protein